MEEFYNFILETINKSYNFIKDEYFNQLNFTKLDEVYYANKNYIDYWEAHNFITSCDAWNLTNYNNQMFDKLMHY